MYDMILCIILSIIIINIVVIFVVDDDDADMRCIRLIIEKIKMHMIYGLGLGFN